MSSTSTEKRQSPNCSAPTLRALCHLSQRRDRQKADQTEQNEDGRRRYSANASPDHEQGYGPAGVVRENDVFHELSPRNPVVVRQLEKEINPLFCMVVKIRRPRDVRRRSPRAGPRQGPAH